MKKFTETFNYGLIKYELHIKYSQRKIELHFLHISGILVISD